MIVEYADSLAMKVKRGETSEKEAAKQWASYKEKEGAPSSVEEAMQEINEHNAKARECYQRVYPQFHATETARRSAIDAQMQQRNMQQRILNQQNQPKHTNCNTIGGITNCTTW